MVNRGGGLDLAAILGGVGGCFKSGRSQKRPPHLCWIAGKGPDCRRSRKTLAVLISGEVSSWTEGSFPLPCVSFSCFLLSWKKARKTTKKQGCFIPTEPLKFLEKEGKDSLKQKKEKEKKQGIPKNKERKDRVFF